MQTDYEKFTGMLKEFGIAFSVEGDVLCDLLRVYVGRFLDKGATMFAFNYESEKFIEYDLPLVDNCLTRRM